MPINARIAEPASPGRWVDEAGCACGAVYEDFIAGVRFVDGAQAVRRASGSEDGGYRSRGPVLWAMRVLKLTEWYLAHATCGAFQDELRRT